MDSYMCADHFGCVGKKY